jgi:hypothetical protein
MEHAHRRTGASPVPTRLGDKTVIGIYTASDDPHAQHVMHMLEQRRIPFIRFDRADFTQEMRFVSSFSSQAGDSRCFFTIGDARYSLNSLTSIWYRRPTKTFPLADSYAPAYAQYAQSEARKGFDGVLRGLPCLWVSHPAHIEAADWKPLQLRAAQNLGFPIPETVITNDVQAVKEFFTACNGNIVYKSLSSGALFNGDGSRSHVIFTTPVTWEMIDASIGVTANLFQEFIAPKEGALRINVIGQHVFATRISAHSEEAYVDWRQDYDALTYTAYQLPPRVEDLCLKLVRHFHLVFSTIDLIVRDGKYFFLDLNANGQWLWIEQETGQPLTEAFIQLLEGNV